MLSFANDVFSCGSCNYPNGPGSLTGLVVHCDSFYYPDGLYLVGDRWIRENAWYQYEDYHDGSPSCETYCNGLLVKEGNDAVFYCLNRAPDQTCEDINRDGFYCGDETILNKLLNLGEPNNC
jgi:hypothetical protein